MERSPQGDGGTGQPAWRDASRPRDEQDRHRSTLENKTDREVSDVVQLHLTDPVAQVTRPEVRNIGYQRVTLAAGVDGTVMVNGHADLTSFAGRDGARVVEPGNVEPRVGRSSADIHHTLPLTVVGGERRTGADRRLVTTARTVVTEGVTTR